MTKQEIISLLFEIMKGIAPEEDLSNVDPDLPIGDQSTLDSMDFIDLVLELWKRYKIEIPEEDYPKLDTFNKWATYLMPKFDAVSS